MKRPKSSSTYQKKTKYKQWGQTANMRSNNQIEFQNYSTQSRANITINSSQANFGKPSMQKDVSEACISPSKIVLHKTPMRPKTGQGGRKLKPSAKFNSIMNRTNTN